MAIFKPWDNNMDSILVLHEKKIVLDGNFFKFLITIWSVFLVLHSERIGQDGKFFKVLITIGSVF
jgi:hypothetical protein